MRFSLLSLAGLTLAALTSALPAQTRVMDVGLTMDLGSVLPAFVGYDCGPFNCQGIPNSPFRRGSVRTFTIFGAPQTPYILGVGAQGPCRFIAGVGNGLLLGAPVIILRVGRTGVVLPGQPCRQGMDVFRYTLPATAPPGFSIRFQGIGVSNSGALAFGPAIDTDIL